MADKLFPAEIMKYSAECHFNKNNTPTLIIYQTVLVLVLVSFISLFFVSVDISVKGIGVLRAVTQDHEVKAIVSGRFEEILVKENDHVEAGQVLANIKTGMLDQEKNMLLSQETVFKNQTADLLKLIDLLNKGTFTSMPTLASSSYQQQFNLFWQRITGLKRQLELVRKNYDRYQQLYAKRLISESEYESVNYTYQRAKSELQLAYKEQATIWQNELNNLKLKKGEVMARLGQVNEKEKFYTLRSPSSGTIKSMAGMQVGSAIAVNEVFAVVSPDSGLIVETYVSPKDIGFLKKGTEAKIQVDAYDYNQWGMASGEVTAVSADIFTDRAQPYFKVRCQLDARQLTLKNGYVGKLRKGMTVQTRFFVTRRTLFQLLYDKADDWLNPNIVSTKQSAVNR